MKKIRLHNSFQLWKEALRYIPNGSQCFSKGPTQFSLGACPIYLKEGKGAYVTDADNNRYIDYGMGLHAAILGYSYPAVTRAITQAASVGINLTLMHPLEVEVARMLVERIPSAEQVRFTKSGSESTAAAIRIARIVTGRDHIAVCGYHGWHDWFIGASERASGVPGAVTGMVHKFRYNHIETLEELFKRHPRKIAAVIMEPCGVVPPQNNFLKACRALAHKHGALFIFDEMITGIRWNEGGAQKMFHVTPDLSTFGKSIANGTPLAAVVGRKQYMKVLNRSDVFISSTFAGEMLSLAACKVTLTVIRQKMVVPFIWKQGEKLMRAFNELAAQYGLRESIEMVGFPCRPATSLKETPFAQPLVLKSYLQQECAKRGVLFTGYFAMSLAHTDSIIDKSLNVFSDVFEELKKITSKKGVKLRDRLEGSVVSPVFRKL